MRNPRTTPVHTAPARTTTVHPTTVHTAPARTAPVRTTTARTAAIAAALLSFGLAAGAGAASTAEAMGVPRPTPVERLMESRLTVTYDATADGPARTSTLECSPLGGGPAVDVGCARLEEIGGPEGEVPAGQMCSMIYGGPQTAQVTGVWHGRKVHEDYRRTNGCELARWERMVPVLPAVTEASPGAEVGTVQDTAVRS